jgi:hypothetical protein
LDGSFPEAPVWNALTFQWTASDPDGASSITDVELRLNGGAWRPIDPNQKLVSLVLTASGSTELYYGSQELAAANWGYTLDTSVANLIEVRARDLAGSWSSPDTAPTVRVKMPTADVLVVASHSAAADAAWAADLAEAMARAEGAFASLDLEGFRDAHTEARATLQCLEEPLLRVDAAAYHRVEALAAFVDEDDALVI